MESSLKSFLQVSSESDFSIHNIPFGVFSLKDKPEEKACGTRIGDFVINLKVLEEKGLLAKGALFAELKEKVFQSDKLNPFMSLGSS